MITTTVPEADHPFRGADADYICVRVVDALLREDVRGCVSSGMVVANDTVPAGFADHVPDDQRWLEVRHFGDGTLWIPIEPARFMQAWRLAHLPLVWHKAGRHRYISGIDDILACFGEGLDLAAARPFIDFAAECLVAVKHRRLTELQRRHWFEEWRKAAWPRLGIALGGWHERLLHYDRLAAFLDHPFYPTARAKLGFAEEDMRRYAPEFQRPFELNWLAVPREIYSQRGERLPPGWPAMAQVGLPDGLAKDHVLVPVHPFVWCYQLDRFLSERWLSDRFIRAPRDYMHAIPTLSVRTLALRDAPEWHIKLPLTIRTLGARNIRTIKPSTIGDGHRMQSLMSAIAEREPAIGERLLLTVEDTGAHVANEPLLGFIIRRYPSESLQNATVIPVAGLLAHTPHGRMVFEEVVEWFFDGDFIQFLDDYLDTTLTLHLFLWLRYGIALESNQQNSMLVLSDDRPRLRLLIKDNDSARVHKTYLAGRWPGLAKWIEDLEDRRIVVEDELPLAQMFTTITLQLNIAVLIEGMAHALRQPAALLYTRVRHAIERLLAQLGREGEDTVLARATLLEDSQLYIKYLLVAATLVDKSVTGVADVNKFYGKSAPNFLREGQ